MCDNSLSELLSAYSSIFAVCDRNVRQHAFSLAKGMGIDEDSFLAIDGGEKNKTMPSVMDITRWLMEKGADRQSLLLAIGGGTVTDMAGFAAGIFKRGIAYANIPTTLLGMVDASVGGKTGVNLDGYKNMLGLFHQPEFTYVLPEFLETLPEKELLSGSAELLKTFIVADEEKYNEAVKVLSSEFSIPEIAPLIQAAASIKEDIVNEDPFEQGRRRVLNLGHTWGHAIEWWQREKGIADPMSHGEAVAVGIIQAAIRSEEEGVAERGLVQRLRTDFEACGLPVDLPCPEEELLPAMMKDKKSCDGKIRFVLIEKIGKVI